MLAALSLVPVVGLSGYLAARLTLRVAGRGAAPHLASHGSGVWLALGTSLAAGLLVNTALVMLLRDFGRVTLVSCLLALGGLALALHAARSGAGRIRRVPVLQAALFAALFIPLAGQCLAMPVAAWDARSIWFFHAKVLYFAGGLQREPIAYLAGLGFDHADYPKLVAGLAAQAAWLAGFWNEYLPRLGVLLALLPLLCWTFSAFAAPLAFMLIVGVFWIWQSDLLTNGYMDGMLAFYGFCAALFLGRAARTGSFPHLLAGMYALGIALGLKNEGQLLTISLAVGGLATALLGRRRLLAARCPNGLATPSAVLMLAVAFCGAAAWIVLCRDWGIRNDLDLAGGGVSRALARLADPWSLARSVWWGIVPARMTGVLAAAGLAATWFVLRSRGPSIESVLAPVSGLVYLAGIVAIYLSTPYDLVWHLKSSVQRTTLLPAALCLVPLVALIESSGLPSGPPRPAGTGRRAWLPTGRGNRPHERTSRSDMAQHTTTAMAARP